MQHMGVPPQHHSLSFKHLSRSTTVLISAQYFSYGNTLLSSCVTKADHIINKAMKNSGELKFAQHFTEPCECVQMPTQLMDFILQKHLSYSKVKSLTLTSELSVIFAKN